MINLIVIVQFFEAIYTSLFKHFFVARFIKSSLLGQVITYFDIVETNS